VPVFLLGEAEDGQRLDVALARVARIPRAQARRWIEEGRVRLNMRECRPAERVNAGDELEATPREPVSSELVAEPIPLAILYEDADLIVIDKPAGLVVHPAPGHASGTLVHALLHHCRDLSGIGGVRRPGIVHRLDRGTSGVLVAAKDDVAHLALARQFREHDIERVYLALVCGMPRADVGSTEQAIGRHPRDRKRMSVRARASRAARTSWGVLQRFPATGMSWLEVRPETGRTHQIRVHLSSAGLPIAGDPVYGRGRVVGLVLRRPALHAAVLGFDHPRSGARMRFEAPLPADLRDALSALQRREATR
jgi:23S rRNA pseudouridine1911/1915/1917 synthase